MNEGHYAEGSGWSKIYKTRWMRRGFIRVHGHIHYDKNGVMKFYPDSAGEDLR